MNISIDIKRINIICKLNDGIKYNITFDLVLVPLEDWKKINFGLDKKGLGEYYFPMATVISKELIKDYIITDELNIDSIFVIEDIWNIMEDNERKALIEHEIIHLIKGHKIVNTSEEHKKFESEVDEEMSIGSKVALDILDNKLLKLGYQNVFIKCDKI